MDSVTDKKYCISERIPLKSYIIINILTLINFKQILSIICLFSLKMHLMFICIVISSVEETEERGSLTILRIIYNFDSREHP